MGIFDYVRCRYPLPHYQDAEFQTKDVARIVDPGDPVDGLLDQYVITKTGRLRRQMHKRNAVKTGRKFPSGAPQSTRGELGVGECRGSVKSMARSSPVSRVCTREDIDTAWCALKDAARRRIHVFLATSAIHREFKLNMAKEQIVQMAVEGVTFARSGKLGSRSRRVTLRVTSRRQNLKQPASGREQTQMAFRLTGRRRDV